MISLGPATSPPLHLASDQQISQNWPTGRPPSMPSQTVLMLMSRVTAIKNTRHLYYEMYGLRSVLA